MTVSEFQSLINGKYFVELTSVLAVNQFCGLSEESTSIRTAATNAGVIVFLSTINKIFARGTYYGTSPDEWTAITDRLTALENTITSMGTPLANLATIVAGHSTAIDNNTAAIATNTKHLLGDSTVAVPAKPNDPDDPNYATDYAAYMTAKNAHDGLIKRVVDLEGQIAQATGNSGGLSQAVNDLVDARLQSVLSGQIADYLEDNNYVTSSDLIIANISGLAQALNEKAAATDFSALAALIGAGSLEDTANWYHLDGNSNNRTVVSVVNEIAGTTNTLSTNLSSLTTTVNALTGLPHLSIAVVDIVGTEEVNGATITNYLPNVQTPSAEVIYLARSPQTDQDTNDLFTEWIWANKNATKMGTTNPETGEPYEAEYVWEKLGRQAFKIDNYLDETQINQLLQPIQEYIADIHDSFDSTKAAQITTNTNNITTLQTTVQGIQTTLNSLIQNGVLQFTGEDINTTSDPNSNTIAQDIALLKSGKLDVGSMEWIIINEDITNTTPEENNGGTGE